MTIYAVPEAQRLARVRRWLIVVLVSFLPIGLYLLLNSTGRSAEIYRVLWIGAFVVLMNIWNTLRGGNGKIASAFRVNAFELDSEGLRMHFGTWTKFITRNEIIRVEEPPKGRGMYVRTPRRFSWFIIPRRIDRYDELRSELSAMGIPIVPRVSAPPNWGILFVFLFCASLLCDLLTQDRRVLVVNLGVALILAGAGILTSSWIGDRGLKRLSILGSFLPAVLSAVSLIFPFGIQ